MEQTVTPLADGNSFANTLVKPTIIRDVTLLAPGIWTGADNHPTSYTGEAIRNGFMNSDWENMNLFLDHKDTNGSAVAYWIGFVRNAGMSGGELKGDLEIWHPLISMFIKQAKAKFGVSATMVGSEHINNQTGNYDYNINSFRSLSIVDDPGCGTCWLPKMLSHGEKGDKKVIGGAVEEKQIKSLAIKTPSNSNDLSQKSLAESKDISADSTLRTIVSKERSEKQLEHCKEVEKMTEENQSEKSMEEKEEVKKEDATESKASTSEDTKELSAKIEKLTEIVTGLSETVKSLSAEVPAEAEAPAEKPAEEEKSEEKSEDKSAGELNDTKKELEATRKELAALKEEVNSPDKKTLAATPSAEVSVQDANSGMLGFLRESSNIAHY